MPTFFKKINNVNNKIKLSAQYQKYIFTYLYMINFYISLFKVHYKNNKFNLLN